MSVFYAGGVADSVTVYMLSHDQVEIGVISYASSAPAGTATPGAGTVVPTSFAASAKDAAANVASARTLGTGALQAAPGTVAADAAADATAKADAAEAASNALSASLYLPFAGGDITGELGLVYSGTVTDVIQSKKRNADPFNFYEARADGRTQFMNPFAPSTWGTHVNGARGTGSDFDHLIEHTGDTASMLKLTYAKQRVKQGSNYTGLTFPSSFPLNNTAGHDTLTVASTTGFSASGSLNFSSGANGTTGTITYTSKDATHFYGCTSTGIPAPTDTSQVYALWITDSFGAPILWSANYGGAIYANDQIIFRAAGVFTDADQDIIIGFDDAVARTGASIKIGNDGNVKEYRANDGFGNNEWVFHADGNLLRWYSAGLYNNAAQNLGTTTNPWGVMYSNRTRIGDGTQALPAYSHNSESSSGWWRAGAGDLRLAILAADSFGVTASKIWVPTASTFDFGTDGNVRASRSDDGFGNNIYQLKADANTVKLSIAGFYPNTINSLDLGTTINFWRVLYAGRSRVGDGTTALPSHSFNNETATGHYRAGAGDIRFSLSNSDLFKLTSAGLTLLNSKLFSTGTSTHGEVTSSPEGVVTGNPGDTRVDSAAGIYYVKKSGTGNKGWEEYLSAMDRPERNSHYGDNRTNIALEHVNDVLIGDSAMVAAGAASRDLRWWKLLQDAENRAAGLTVPYGFIQADGGDAIYGYLKFDTQTNGSAGTGDQKDQWILGTTTGAIIGHTAPARSISVYYVKGASQPGIQISADGGSTWSATQTTTGSGVGVYTTADLGSVASRALRIKTMANGTVPIVGADFMATAGASGSSMHVLAIGGTTSTAWDSSTYRNWVDYVTFVQPRRVLISLMGNDALQSGTLSNLETHLDSVASRARTAAPKAHLVIFGLWRPGSPSNVNPVSNATWPQWVAVARRVANKYGGTFVNLYERFGDISATNDPDGVAFTDNLHLNDTRGQPSMARLVSTVMRTPVEWGPDKLKQDLSNITIGTVTPAMRSATPWCAIRHTVQQAIPSGVWTPVGFNTNIFDPYSMHTLNTSSTTITSGSNAVALPTATINVVDTTGFPSAGFLLINGPTAASTTMLVQYTGKTGTTFTGCTLGAGTLATSQVVTFAGTEMSFPQGGVYTGQGEVSFAAHATGIRGVRLRSMDGTFNFVCATLEVPTTNTASQHVAVATIFNMAAATKASVTFRMEVFQSSGTNLVITPDNLQAPQLAVAQYGPASDGV